MNRSAKKNPSGRSSGSFRRNFFLVILTAAVLLLLLASGAFSLTQVEYSHSVTGSDWITAIRTVNELMAQSRRAADPDGEAVLKLSTEEVNSLIRVGLRNGFMWTTFASPPENFNVRFDSGRFVVDYQHDLGYGIYADLRAAATWSPERHAPDIHSVDVGFWPVPAALLTPELDRRMNDPRAAAVLAVLRRIISRIDYRSDGVVITYRPDKLRPYWKYFRGLAFQ